MHSIVIIPPEGVHESKKGDFFEELMGRVFSVLRYKITERVNFTGMEIDLLGDHLDRTGERAYIECKARKSLSSNDITSFTFKVEFKKTTCGYVMTPEKQDTQRVYRIASLSPSPIRLLPAG